MAQVLNKKTGEVHGDPNPELDVCWLNGSITTPGKRAPQIPLRDAMKLLDSNPDLVVTCPDGKWWGFGG